MNHGGLGKVNSWIILQINMFIQTKNTQDNLNRTNNFKLYDVV